jgi:hypothetical protein
MRWNLTAPGTPLPVALLVVTSAINLVVAAVVLVCTLAVIVVVAGGMTGWNALQALTQAFVGIVQWRPAGPGLHPMAEHAESRLP